MPAVPRRRGSYGALRLLVLVGRRFGCPSQCGPPLAGVSSVPAAGTPEPAARRRLRSGSPLRLLSKGRARALPGYWATLSCRATLQDPAECGRRLARYRRRRCCLQEARLPGPSGTSRFEAFIAAQHLACLRIAAAIAGPGARLASGLLGSALAGRDPPPLDDCSEFHQLPHHFFLSDQHCLVTPCSCSCSCSKCEVRVDFPQRTRGTGR